ncbi:MAG: SLBB domain-containing protein [candidate division KSB1 bacterium]|nr:SLBB domain-containing protein [candidate division KSB1 bacterium]MDZ7301014.1 SLBB domain-containing protein [candidate division KSB1 bacterium]MDZ7310308.1 SLBB domain-containing protein [candidate division KSB1 bacterium]
MRQFFIVLSLLVFLLLSFLPAAGQLPGEKTESNQFLNDTSSESLDLLERYYQRIFSQPGKPRSSRLGADSLSDPTVLILDQVKRAFGLEGPIDPANYIVGPYDVLAVNVWGVAPFAHVGPITPEGTLILPTVGEIAVAGDTLSQVKRKIQQAVRKKYTASEISVNLVSLRTFKVTVVGVVNHPGTYAVTPVDRVDRVVYLANLGANSNNESSAGKKSKQPGVREGASAPSISLRNIKLYRATRDTIEVDLVRYYATGETRFNPYLLDGDVIFVPAENRLGNRVSILGGVRVPGSFEFRDGDSLQTLLKIAQGATALADLEHVEVVRFLPDGRQAQILVVNLHAGQNGQTPDMPLRPNDRIFIREKWELRQERSVYVNGAVVRPGEYALLNDHMTLSEIIELAGGFTPEASLAEARLIRKYVNPEQLLNNPEYVRLLDIRLTDLKPEDREYFNYEMVIKRGIVAVDFAKLFNHQDKSADVLLWDGDEIYVPSIRNTVNVFGQVINPGYVTYVEGMDYRYYVQKAGGFSKEADRDKVRVLKRDTKAWMKPEETKVEPGDQIFVSRAVRQPFAVYYNTVREILQTTAGLATVVLLYLQVSK